MMSAGTTLASDSTWNARGTGCSPTYTPDWFGLAPRSTSSPSPPGVRATPGRFCSARSGSPCEPGSVAISSRLSVRAVTFGARAVSVGARTTVRYGLTPCGRTKILITSVAWLAVTSTTCSKRSNPGATITRRTSPGGTVSSRFPAASVRA
jgi:hypothetical protein